MDKFTPAQIDQARGAAPELLGALVGYDNAFTGFNPDDKVSRHTMRLAVIAARAAIAKATGPTSHPLEDEV